MESLLMRSLWEKGTGNTLGQLCASMHVSCGLCPAAYTATTVPGDEEKLEGRGPTVAEGEGGRIRGKAEGAGVL